MIKKKKWMGIIGVLLMFFGAYNLFWYFGIYQVYNKYEKNFKEVADSGVRIYEDTEGYQYSVNKPSYLLWDGNLAITEKDMKYALIIWLEIGGSHASEGVLLVGENGELLQIELKDSKTAMESYNQEIVDKNLEIIFKLYEKANQKWGLEIE